jgi:hypothetical protein
MLLAARRLARATLSPSTGVAARAVVTRRGFFANIEQGPEDPILGLSIAFNNVLCCGLL